MLLASTPNLLTALRILLIPVLVAIFYLAPLDWRYLASAAIFTLAAVTDWLDGYLARRWGEATPFGAFLDPVADKLIVAVALVLLVEAHASAILAVPALVIVGREIVVSALREWMARYAARRSVAVSMLGKVKTIFQMVAIILLLGAGPGPAFYDASLGPQALYDAALGPQALYDASLGPRALAQLLGYGLLYTAALLTLWSMCEYLKLAWPDLSSGMAKQRKIR